MTCRRPSALLSILTFLLILDVCSAPPASRAASCANYDGYFRPVAFVQTPSLGVDLAFVGNLAVVACQQDALVVYDLTDPSAPVLLADVPSAATVQALAVADGWAYVAVAGGELLVFDLADPGAPAPVTSAALAGDAEALSVDGTLLGAAVGTAGVQFFDVTDPAAVAAKATLATPGTAHDIVLRGDVAYVADDAAGVQVVGIADPAAPAIVGGAATGTAISVRAEGTRVYAGNRYTGISVVDVANGASPAIVGSVSAATDNLVVEIQGPYLMVEQGTGLHLYDISTPDAPVLMRDLGVRGRARMFGDTGVLVALARSATDQLAIYAAEGFAALDPAAATVDTRGVHNLVNLGHLVVGDAGSSAPCVYDIADPEAPVKVADLPSAGNGAGLAVLGPYLLLGGRNALFVYDLADPTQPVTVGSVATYDVQRIVPDGDVAYAYAVEQVWNGYYLEEHPHLVSIDLADPASPAILQDIPDAGVAVAVRDGLLYVKTLQGYQLYDVADPANLVPAGAVDAGDEIRLLVIRGDRAYVDRWIWESGVGRNRFEVWDLADPLAPAVVGGQLLPSQASDVLLRDGIAYVALTLSGAVDSGIVLRVDLADEAHPQLAGTSYAGRYPQGLLLIDGRLWVASDGLKCLTADCADTGMADAGTGSVPRAAALVTAAPNPFNPRTTIRFRVPHTGPARLVIHDLAGREVAVLVDGTLAEGAHGVQWDGRGTDGAPVGSGVYLVRVVGDGFAATAKLALVR